VEQLIPHLEVKQKLMITTRILIQSLNVFRLQSRRQIQLDQDADHLGEEMAEEDSLPAKRRELMAQILVIVLRIVTLMKIIPVEEEVLVDVEEEVLVFC